MEANLAEAVLKLAEVHDRRLGEIAAALGRLADEMTAGSDVEKPTAMDRLTHEISQLGGSVEMIANNMPAALEDGD